MCRFLPCELPTVPLPPLVLDSYRRVEPYVPAISFFGGFTWDSLTLGRNIRPLDLAILGLYFTAASLILVLIGREVAFKGSKYLNFGLQWCFGCLFSALVIFYFISSSHFPAFVLTGGLVVLLVGNEFLEKSYASLTLSWTFFTLTGVMLFNFVLPHLVRSVHWIWFYAGVGLALAALFGLRRLSTRRSGQIGPSLVAVGLLVVAHWLNWIPPVPLVKTDMAICRDLRKENGAFVAAIEKPWTVFFWKHSETSVRQRPGEKIFCYTSIFLPKNIETTIYHQWAFRGQNGWENSTRVPVTIRGGRLDGFRVWSYKQTLPPGRWRVTAETGTGAVIGRAVFSVTPLDAGKTLEFKKIRLR